MESYSTFLTYLTLPTIKNLSAITVTTGESSCAPIGGYRPIPVSPPSGFLASWVTKEIGRGGGACPWQISGAPGQKIQLTLVDFGVWRGSKDPRDGDGSRPGSRVPEHSGICHIYARIREGGSGSITLCGGEQREKVVYVSEGHKVEVEVTDPRAAPDPSFFIIKYERK